MASFTGELFLAYLLSVSFTDEFSFNTTAIDRLVDYEYDFASSTLIPGKLYSGTIIAIWAIPDGALTGLEGQSISVKVSATADENSSVFFPVLSGAESKTAEALLTCEVQNGTCSNSSTLSSPIPVMFRAKEGESAQQHITLRSEISDGAASDLAVSAGSLFYGIAGILEYNSTQNHSEENQSHENLLDSFKAEGNPSDPISFLRNNPIISIAALAIVIIITGAYLLNSRD